jgi:hypothetical protein
VLALGITFALTAAQPTLTLTSIKAVDVERDNKDQWSVKGYVSDPDGDFVPAIGDNGLSAYLGTETAIVNTVDFTAADCKVLNNDKGVICRATGARISLKRTKRVPKDAMMMAQKNKNTTSSVSSYYKVSGVFRRQQFESTLTSDLTVYLYSDSLGDDYTMDDCRESGGARATKFLCK